MPRFSDVKRKLVSLALGAAALQACDRGAASLSENAAAAPVAVVDSVFPIEEEIRRFRALLGPDPGSLTEGARSIDALVDRFERALVEADTAAFAEMAMTMDEFGWIYYPSSIFTAPPYELAPSLVWFQIQNGSSRGLGRLLDRLAGRPLVFMGHTCPPEPVTQGPNRVWEGCLVRFETADEGPRELQLFGSILERDGVFKFVSYTNGY
jgi:hypothetical protein